jgi:hypothetical protein
MRNGSSSVVGVTSYRQDHRRIVVRFPTGALGYYLRRWCPPCLQFSGCVLSLLFKDSYKLLTLDRYWQVSEINLFQCYFIHHKSHMVLPGIESKPSRWETGIKPPEPWHGPGSKWPWREAKPLTSMQVKNAWGFNPVPRMPFWRQPCLIVKQFAV